MDEWEVRARYLKINKFFGQFTGVWPYQNRFLKNFLRFLTTIWTLTAFVTQIAKVVVFYSIDTLSGETPFLILSLSLLTRHCNYVLNEHKLQDLLDNIVYDWTIERPEEEVAILDAYSSRAAFFTSFYRANICISSFFFSITPTVPFILDIVIPLNESRDRLLIYPAYYFVDEEKYYFFIIGHMLLSAMLLPCVFIGCDSNLMCTVHHACALLMISGHRFKHAVDDTYNYHTKDARVLRDIQYDNVCRSIDAHNRAVKYIEKVEACHEKCLFYLMGLTIMAFSITLLQATTLEMSIAFITFVVFAVAQIIHVLFLTIMGQFVINSNEEVFRNICEALWYKGSTRTQLLYVLVMRKCITPPELSCGGFIPLNLDSFQQILKASFSYYTVLRNA
ncbi:uncharacterized protein LOC128879640 [Hylaeus volcanicus]|uniref:uncharacterized protein LOC128879640 n=1 Tax=Hylaeus volcanicus TaxID=313075 RepID=UPI0023B79F1F|nr:uncharacterized protein LOC128879640 [Hylaeus volcanicus]